MSVGADVVVIGAGAAGLSCAQALVRAGLRPVVWEARDRPGGRIATWRTPDDQPIELGAQVVHGSDNPLWMILEEHELTSSFRDARPSAVLSGQNVSMGALARTGTPPWYVESRLPEAPAGATVAELLANLDLPPREHRSGSEWLRQTWGTDPEQLDGRELAAVRRHENTGEGEYLLRRGYDILVGRLADGLSISFSRPVEGVELDPSCVRLYSGDHSLTARAAVLTAPPSSVVDGPRPISGLPSEKARAARSLPSGDALSLVAELPERAAENRVIFDADHRAGFLRTFAGSRHALAVAKGETASWLRSAARAPGRLEALLTRAGLAGGIEHVHVTDWGLDPYARGGFSFPVSRLDIAARAWAEPIAGTLFFAGEATCGHRWPASVHGAVASGERAAAEVEESLRCQSNSR